MKVKELIQRIQSLYSKGVESDDTRLSSRHIYNKLVSVRSRLVSQQAKKKQKVSQWNYQTLPCIKLIKVPAHDCPCLPPLGCEILRSEHKLPAPLSGLSNDLIDWVRSIEKSIKIDRISINALSSQKGNKYSNKKLQFFIENEYLYISTPSNLKVVSMRALFEDPLEAEQFIGYCNENGECTDCGCIDFQEYDFPIDNDLVDTLVEMTIREVVLMFSQSVEDTTNDTRDNIKQQSK